MKQAEFNSISQHHVSHGQQGSIQALCIADDGALILTGSDSGAVQLFHTRSGNLQQTFTGHDAPVTTVTFSVDNRYALSASDDHTVKVWDLVTGGCVQILSGHKAAVRGLCTHPDKRLLVSVADDNDIRIWDFPSGQCLQVLKGHQKPVTACSTLSDWQYLLTGGQDKVIRLWNLASASKVADIGFMGGHVAEIVSIKASYDDATIVTASRDGTVRLWDIAHNKARRNISAHSMAVTDMSLSLDGENAVSVAKDGEIKLWQFPQGDCIATIREALPDGERRHAIMLSGDMQHVVATNEHGGMDVFPIDWDYRSVALSDVSHEIREAFYSAFLRRQTPQVIMRNVRSAASGITLTGGGLGKPRWQKVDLLRFNQVLLHALHVKMDVDQLGNNLKIYFQEEGETTHAASQVEEAKTREDAEPPPPGFKHEVARGLGGHARHYLPGSLGLVALVMLVVVIVYVGHRVRLQVNDHASMQRLEQAMDKGVDISRLRLNGLLPLHDASRNDHRETLRYLLRQGADINRVDRNGWSALHYAVAKEDEDMVEFLLANGARSDLPVGKSHVTPIWIAHRMGNEDLLHILRPLPPGKQ